MLLKEPNYTRKAQRVDLPLLVQIQGRSYKTKDWSLAGVGILDLDLDFGKDKEVACRLILPLEGANFVLPAAIVMKNQRGAITGCEFKNLDPKNKRVLRRFIELAIEGRIDNVEDFIAAYSEPVFETPITEALALEEKEALKIKKTFLKKSLAYLFVGLVAAAVIGYTMLYNLQYKVFSTGVVTGSFVKVTANGSGILDRIHVRDHDAVDAGLVLFDLTVTETVRRPVAPAVDVAAAELESIPDADAGDVADLLKERARRKQQALEDAEALYAQRLITFKDYSIIQDHYLRARIDYERERERLRADNERIRNRLALIQDKLDAVKRPSYETVAVTTLKRRISPIEGTVYRVERSLGEFVHPDQTVMVLQTREKPFVVVKLHSRDIYKVRIGDQARIYSTYNNTYHRGAVTQIGYAAVNADATISQESSLNESLVKIEFADDAVDFPLNTRVEVRIRRDLFQG